jgi:rod shape-determining protein MreC
MALLSLDGAMVGFVEGVSAGNSICVSVLNTGFRASGTVGDTGHFGSISWQGFDPRTVRLSEVPKYAAVERGDTIRTSGYSFNFPEGIMVGFVDSFEVDDATASYNIDVRLAADVGSLRDVILVDRPEVYERVMLEQETLGTEAEEVVDGAGSGGRDAKREGADA